MLTRRLTRDNIEIVDRVYVIPTREEYLSKRHDKGASWETIYRKRCCVCNEYFEECEMYVVVSTVDEIKARHKNCILPQQEEQDNTEEEDESDIVEFDGEQHIMAEGESMTITAHQTPISIKVINLTDMLISVDEMYEIWKKGHAIYGADK